MNRNLRIPKIHFNMMDGKWRHPRQGWRCTKSLSSFSNEKLEVQKLTRTSIFEPSRELHFRLMKINGTPEYF